MARAKQDVGKSLERLKKEAQARAEEAEAEAAEGEEDGLPDGGWGWMVVLASLVCNIIVDGVCYSFAIFKEHYMDEFKASNEQAGWVGSLLAGCYLTVGPIVGVLEERFGARKVTMVGSAIACFGFIASTQATSIEMLIVTWGVIGGIGFGMIYLPAIVTVGHWFDKKRAFATGLAVCGTGVGTFIFAPLSQRLIQEYEWRGAHLIMAGVVLNCAVCGAIFKPLDKVKKVTRQCYQSQVEIERGAIMKALIEEKKRQRTISNGSLDNCIITKDNRLIKIDPALFECKRTNSFIARFKRSLGFSSQSLNKSKSSLAGIPSIVINAVNEAQKEGGSGSGAKLSPIYRPSSGKQLKTPQSSSQGMAATATETDSPRSGTSEDSGVCIDGQNLGTDTMSLNDLWLHVARDDVGAVASSCQSVNNPVIVPGHKHPGLEGGSIISVQLLPHFSSADEATFPASHRRHHSTTRSSGGGSYCNSAFSKTSFVSRSFLSIPQQVSECSLHSMVAELERAERRKGTVMALLCTLRDMLEVTLLRSPVFSLLVVASILSLLAFFIPFFYVTVKAEELGMAPEDSYFLLSIIGITNTVGRIISGWIADRPWINALHLNNGALIIAGVGTILVAFCHSLPWLCVYAAGFGICVAVFVSLRSILLVELLGIDMLTKSFGILILFQGISTMVGAPMAGRLLDTTGTVDGCFIMAGVLLLVSGLLGFPLWLLKRRQQAVKSPVFLLPEEVPITQTLKAEGSAI
ncbi:monocarboxylate transporter 5-like [Babylonia areolata]|uniref:monocarboxylate transporter 5-like n=1 Tax=Babylonia areolata TaxID=304850 RepID=UPI003FD5E2DA